MNPNRKPWVKSFAKRWSKRLLLTALWIGGLGTLFFGIENWRAKRALAEHYEWLKSKGESLDPAQFDPAPVPDEDNAALVPVLECFYKRDADGKRVWRHLEAPNSTEQRALMEEWDHLLNMLSLLEEAISGSDGLDFQRCVDIIQKEFSEDAATLGPSATKASEVTPSSAAELVRGLLARSKTFLTGLREAANRPRCIWPKPSRWPGYDPGGAITNNVEKILLMDGKIALFKHDSATVFLDLLAQLHLVSHSAWSPSVMGGLFDCGIHNHSIDLLRLSLGASQFDDSQWSKIAEAIESGSLKDKLRIYLRGERILREANFDSLPPRNWGITTVEGGRRRSTTPRTFVFMYGPSGWRDRNRINANIFTQTMLEALENDSRPPAQNLSSLPAPRSNSPYEFLTETISYQSLYIQICRYSERLQLAPVAIALKRYQIKHGTFPNELTQVIPEFLPKLPQSYFNAMVPKYRRLPEGSFKIWFYDLDGDDDDGRSQDRSKDGAGPDCDIVFTPGPPIP